MGRRKRRILICGSRDFNDENAIAKVIIKYQAGDILICGMAKGADSIAFELGKLRGMEVMEFPANWDLYGRAAGPIRNQQMLDKGKPEKVYAFYSDKEKSKGTKDMVKRSRKAGVKTVENK
jgi:hypothetical protein